MPRKAKVAAEHPVAEDYASLIHLLTEMRPRLSKRLQQIAKFFMNNPEDIAIYNIVEIAAQAEVHPSAITRFSKELGFTGFNELQNVFRQRLVGPKQTYAERMKALVEANEPPQSGVFDLQDPSVVFDTFVNAAMDALLRIREDVDREALKGFVEVLSNAQVVHVAAARGAFGVGAYCYYSLSRIGKRAHLIDNLGAMREHQVGAIGDNDVLLAITFDDYTPETIEVTQAAHKKGRNILVITDNELSPVAKLGQHALYVKDARLGHFRSQVPAMVLCQSIIVSLGRQKIRAQPQA